MMTTGKLSTRWLDRSHLIAVPWKLLYHHHPLLLFSMASCLLIPHPYLVYIPSTCIVLLPWQTPSCIPLLFLCTHIYMFSSHLFLLICSLYCPSSNPETVKHCNPPWLCFHRDNERWWKWLQFPWKNTHLSWKHVSSSLFLWSRQLCLSYWRRNFLLQERTKMIHNPK